MSTDVRIASALVALYFVATFTLLPYHESLRALAGGAIVFGGVLAIARTVKRGPVTWMDIFAVAVIAGAVLWVPTFPAMGGRVKAAIPLGFFGMHAAALLWAALRWTEPQRRPDRVSLVQAWRYALLSALVLSAVATIGVTMALHADVHRGIVVLWVYPAYFVGLLAAATCFWALQRFRHLAVGLYVIGVLAGICLYGAVAPLLPLLDGEPMHLSEMLMVTVIAGSIVGPPVALGLEQQHDDRANREATGSRRRAPRKRGHRSRQSVAAASSGMQDAPGGEERGTTTSH
ncbi:MAG TPA: hypothetical protein VFK13_07525 [Gemmatimonadaceae bacterium]|nr:hypothetical protein [Gemmatimonadaceae bacterium]